MKEQYFSEQSIESTASQMLSELSMFRKRHSLNYNPARSALILLDMQKYFFVETSHAYIPSAPAIIPGVRNLMSKYISNGLPVIATRHVNTPQNAGALKRWWENLITEESVNSVLIDEIDFSECSILSKNQYDAFYDTGLESILNTYEVSQVVICGVMTHLCCETTARSAFVRGYDVLFAVDGTASYSKQFHLATLLNLAHGFATPVLIQELINIL